MKMKKKQIIKELEDIQRRLRQLECEHKITIIRNSEHSGYNKKCIFCGKIWEVSDEELIKKLAQDLRELCKKNNIKEEDIEI